MTHMETSIQTADGTVNTKNDYVSGVRIGGGISTFINENWSFRAEYLATIHDKYTVPFSDGSFSGNDEFESSESAFKLGLSYYY